MDDRDLEARLSNHLHQRFDGSPVPSGLAAAVRQSLETSTAKVGFSFRPRALHLGWAATVAIVLTVGALLLNGRILGPAVPGTSPSPTVPPSAFTITERWFVVLAADGASPSAAQRDAATQSLMDRLTRLGLKSTQSEQPGMILLTLEREGLQDDDIRHILTATGDVEFVPLPPEAYGDIDVSALVGKPLPIEEPALFGNAGIASVALGSSEQGFPTIDVVLTPEAGAAFGAWTTAHAREYLAVVIDGRMVVAPIINEPITGGQVSITGGANVPGRPDTAFAVAAAIMVGGRLPDAWQGADVRRILTQDEAIEAARASGHGGSGDIEGADLDAFQDGARWTTVWRVSYVDGAVVTLDAVTGQWLSTGVP